MKKFDRRGLILKLDTILNQSVPILVSNLSNKPITILQIANPLSQTRVSRYKVFALQKDRICLTGLLWFFFLVWTNYRRRWSTVSQPASGELSPSINVTLQSNPVMGWIVKYEDRETSRFFISWSRILNLTERRNFRSKYQKQHPNCLLCALRENDWNGRIGKYEHRNWIRKMQTVRL